MIAWLVINPYGNFDAYQKALVDSGCWDDMKVDILL